MSVSEIHVSEIITILSLVVICVLSIFFLDPEVSKDISISVTSGLLGYLTKTAVQALKSEK